MDNQDHKPQLDKVIQLLLEATSRIQSDYFIQASAGDDENAAAVEHCRERVYAYELYHQLRSIWPSNWNYMLAGEIDKTGHALIRSGEMRGAKPDLVVHRPGRMDCNLLVVEIKPVDLNRRFDNKRFVKDLRKLVAFRRKADYALAIALLFGEKAEHIRDDIAARSNMSKIDLELVDLWNHSAATEPARKLEWGSR